LLLARDQSSPLTMRERVDLSTLLCDVGEALRPLASAKGLTLAYFIPDGLHVAGDSEGLIRLFVNLVDNAIKYTEHGQIDLSAAQDLSGVQVAINDTGCGIPAEHLPHIFDRFYRVDASRSTSGSGLGLAIARDLVSAHGGSIEVTSEVNKGTTFSVRLPTLHTVGRRP